MKRVTVVRTLQKLYKSAYTFIILVIFVNDFETVFVKVKVEKEIIRRGNKVRVSMFQYVL